MDITSYLLGKQAGGGGGSSLQTKSVTITENKTTNITPDLGYDGMSSVSVTTNVPSSGVDLNDYMNLEITSNTTSEDGFYTRLFKNKQPVKPTVVSTVTNIDRAFINYPGNLDMSDFDFSNITSAYMAFSTMKGDSIIFNNNEIPLLTIFTGLFSASTMTSIDLKIKAPAITTTQNMFQNCTNLVSVDFSNFDISENSTTDLYMRQTFRGCSNLENITFGDFTKFVASKIGRRDNMFAECPKLTNTSLNNILDMCSRINPNDSYSHTLLGLGLTSDQATICTGLSNWASAQAAGWTTGY